MEQRLDFAKEKKLVGKRMTMSFSRNTTPQLWKSFMTQRKEIQHAVGTDLYSMQMYRPQFFTNFNPNAEFEKWATLEVSSFENIPEGMESFTLPGGAYSVFLYKGNENTAGEAFLYILGEWLPGSGYELDSRPHFEILGEKYKNGDPESEEEIWIPIRLKL